MDPNEGFNRNDNGRATSGRTIAMPTAVRFVSWPDGSGRSFLSGCSLSCFRSRMSFVI